jgi:hypothetical protein
MRPFKRKPIVDAETAAWHADNFAWLIRQFDGTGAFAETKLVLPKPGFFVFDGERWRAQEIRAAVRARQTPTGETATHP